MRFSRRIIALKIADLLLINLATLAALYLTSGDKSGGLINYARYAVLMTALRMLALYSFRAYKIHWRYFSLPDLQNVFLAATVSSLGFYAITSIMGGQVAYPFKAQIIDWATVIYLIGGFRMALRWLDWRTARPLDATIQPRKTRTLIVGAGDAGEMVSRELLRGREGSYQPVGFADDDSHIGNIRIHGLPVLGRTTDIPNIVDRHDIETIVIAMPGALGAQIRDIVTVCESTNAKLRILPGVTELMRGEFAASNIRQVEIDDLLRRPPVRVDLDGIASYISGQRVLITGAGGSIGSELCRQVASLNPERLVMFGQGENSIFEIQQEMIRDYGLHPIALIGSVQDRKRLDALFTEHRPNVVFHAAAHKHVPLMEVNPCEAVKNNVIGTHNVAEMALEHGASKMILVSTDKAVHPKSVMGASKRGAEMVIQSFSKQSKTTKFAAVRFGNVLGSRGSVVPIMKRQIAKGGPVTVTHPDMTRYFMTIPEAVQLIIQAGALGANGEIFILDMGEPVKIVDLARDLIKLSGFVPEQDIKIVFTGIRPGEKIFEELLTADERNQSTTHEKIFVSYSNGIDIARTKRDIEILSRLAFSGDSSGCRDYLLAMSNGAPLPFHLASGELVPPAPAPDRKISGESIGIV